MATTSLPTRKYEVSVPDAIIRRALANGPESQRERPRFGTAAWSLTKNTPQAITKKPLPEALWLFNRPSPGTSISNFTFKLTTGTVTVDWGDDTITPNVPSDTALSHTYQ